MQWVEPTPPPSPVDTTKDDIFPQEPETSTPLQQEEPQVNWPCTNLTCTYGVDGAPAAVSTENELCQQCLEDYNAHEEASKYAPGPCQQKDCPYQGAYHDGNTAGVCEGCWMDILNKAAQESDSLWNQWWEGEEDEDVGMVDYNFEQDFGAEDWGMDYQLDGAPNGGSYGYTQ